MNPQALSFAEQTMRYFARPHEAPLRVPLAGPAAWRGADMRARSDWRIALGDAQIAELERALAHAAATGRPTGELAAADFPLPTLAPAIADWRRELTDGRGFLVLTGLPVVRWGEAVASVFFWCFGLHLGRPGAQNAAGDLLGHVTDTGEDRADPYVRRYRTAGDIAYHCDAADAVGLLCLRKARRGGLSRIVSSVTVYNELLRRQPELVARLYEPFLLDVRNEDADGAVRWVPVPPCRFAAGRLRTFFHSDYFRSVFRHADVPPPTDLERTLLDTYEAIAAAPDLYLDMDLAPGDVQLLSNHTVLHARTAYEDYREPERRRHLLRLWLTLA